MINLDRTKTFDLNPPKTIKLQKTLLRNDPVVQLLFPYDKELIDLISGNTEARWSQTLGCWVIAEHDFDLRRFFELAKRIAWIDYSEMKLNPVSKPEPGIEPRNFSHRMTTELPKGYLEKLEQKRYSESTIRTYSAYFKDFIHYFRKTPLTEISAEEINSYILALVKNGGISPSQQNQRINAIKFYYEKALVLRCF